MMGISYQHVRYGDYTHMNTHSCTAKKLFIGIRVRMPSVLNTPAQNIATGQKVFLSIKLYSFSLFIIHYSLSPIYSWVTIILFSLSIFFHLLPSFLVGKTKIYAALSVIL
jgi:hypothetical protein